MTDLELRQEMIRRQIETDIHSLECAYSYIQETSNRQDYSLEALDRLSNAISDSKKLLLNHLENIMKNNKDDKDVNRELLKYQIAFSLLLKDDCLHDKEWTGRLDELYEARKKYYFEKAEEEINR